MEGWKEYKLGNVCELITDGKHGDCTNQDNSGYYFLSAKDVFDGSLHYENARQITQRDFTETHRRTRLTAKDILITNSGSIGRMAIAKDISLTQRTTFQKSVAILKPKHDLVNYKYLYYELLGLSPVLIETAVGSAQTNLLLGDLRKFTINLPSLPIQRRIASILSAYDDLIEVNNQRIKLLEETARELYKEWFVRMRFPGHKEAKFVKGVPEGWEVTELHELGKIFTGKTPPTKVKDYYGGDIPFIKTPDLHKNQFIYETEEYLTEKGNNTQKRSTLPKGSICVSCIGTGGIVGITTAEKSQTNQQINSLIPKDKKNLEYLFYSISDLKETIEMYGYTGATMTNLSKGKFEKLKIVFANKELVYKYSDVVKPMFEQIQTLQQQNTQLRQIRDRLLPRLISGKLEVK